MSLKNLHKIIVNVGLFCSISILFTFIIHTVYLGMVPLASREAINIDLRGEYLKIAFSFITSLPWLFTIAYQKIKKKPLLKPHYAIYIFSCIVLAGSFTNHYRYMQENKLIEEIYNSNNLVEIQVLKDAYLKEYQSQPNHEFYKLDILKKLDLKIRELTLK